MRGPGALVISAPGAEPPEAPRCGGCAWRATYGVVSYAVTARKRELSVRLALGATRGSVLRLVLGQGARLVLAGIAVGLVLAFFAVRILATLLYGVQPGHPATFAIVGVGLTVVALVATVIPSHRATRVDPIIAIRAE